MARDRGEEYFAVDCRTALNSAEAMRLAQEERLIDHVKEILNDTAGDPYTTVRIFVPHDEYSDSEFELMLKWLRDEGFAYMSALSHNKCVVFITWSTDISYWSSDILNSEVEKQEQKDQEEE